MAIAPSPMIVTRSDMGEYYDWGLPIANWRLPLSRADAVLQSAGAIPSQPAAAVFGRFVQARVRLQFLAGWIEFPSSLCGRRYRSIAAAFSNSDRDQCAVLAFHLRRCTFRIAESIAAREASNPSRVIPSIGSRCVDEGTRMLKQGRAIGDLFSHGLVNISQFARGRAHHAGGVFENMRIQNAGQRHIAVGLQAPAHRRSGGQAGEADWEILQMAVIAPIGIEMADGAMFEAGLGGGALIGQHVVGAAGDAAPTAGSGADIKRDAALAESAGLGVEGMIGFIAPVQGDRIRGQLRDEVRFLENDVAPEHHSPAMADDEIVHAAKKIEIDLMHAAAAAFVFASALADVEGLIAADVEQAAGEIRQELGIQICQKR